jgi:type I restriction enzyme S subunit
VTPKDLRGLDGPVLEDTPEKITKAGYKSCSTRLLPMGSVLFSSRAPIGLVAITGREMCTNQGFKSLIPGADVDAGYLYWCLKRQAPRIAARSSGTTFSEISRKGMERIKIPLPPLPEQRKIAAILDKANSVRRKRRHTLDLADQFLRSAFLDMFGDPITNPKGWPVESFEECCEAIFKGAFDLKAASYRNEGIPFIRIADIQDRTIDLSNAVFIDEETHEKYGRSELTPGDIVFSKVGTIDRIAAIPKTIPRCNCSQNNVGARLKPDLLQVEFALALLTTSAILNQIRAGSKKAVQDKLVLSELRRLSVILPPAENQHRFTSIVEFVERQRAYQRAHLAKLDALFASLQQRAFRGEL